MTETIDGTEVTPGTQILFGPFKVDDLIESLEALINLAEAIDPLDAMMPQMRHHIAVVRVFRLMLAAGMGVHPDGIYSISHGQWKGSQDEDITVDAGGG